MQVHPDDETGRRLANDNGKTETWVILDAEPGSLIYAGLKQGVGRDEFAAAIRLGRGRAACCTAFEPRPGDCILIEAGTVHAIGAGVLLAEIQQMSDATFRIFDWGRVGARRQAPPAPHPRGAWNRSTSTAGRSNPIVTERRANRRRHGASGCRDRRISPWNA